jgi:hypothetical protein
MPAYYACAGHHAIEEADGRAAQRRGMVVLDQCEAQDLCGAEETDQKTQDRQGRYGQVRYVDQRGKRSRLQHQPDHQRRFAPPDAVRQPAE